jgi:replication initiation protein RepC
MDTDHRMSKHAHGSAPGLRKLTPRMLNTIKAAETHAFTAEMVPGKALAAFKAAAPYLGLRPNVVHAIDWLFRFTDPVDWQPSARPIVWPSAAMQQQDMGLGVSQVKNLNRHLVELGLVMMKDSPNGKRYGRRGPQRRIIEAYGFDLSPIASRFAEFQAIAQAGREERARIAGLRRRATIARNGIRQLMATASEQGITGDEWETSHRSASQASRGLASLKNPDEMEMAVATLERLQREMRDYLEAASTTPAAPVAHPQNLSVDNTPKEPENWPHITLTNQFINPKGTVVASGEGTELATAPNLHGSGFGRILPRLEDQRRPEIRTDSGSLLKITPTQLVDLAPRLKTYLTNRHPRWPEVVDAADWLREELGISKFVWGDACTAMGREQAAITVAIVSTKPAGYFHGSAGAYFHGMVSRARSGELHLTRTLWGMRGRGEQQQKGS